MLPGSSSQEGYLQGAHLGRYSFQGGQRPSSSVAGLSPLEPAFEERMIAGLSNQVESPPNMDASEDIHETPPPMDDEVEEYIA